jgi:hypothetical protein
VDEKLRSKEQADILRAKFNKHFENLQKSVKSKKSDAYGKSANKSLREVANEITDKRGSCAVGPLKKNERSRLEKMEARTGIFNYGFVADSLLRIQPKNRIQKTSWQVAIIIATNRLESVLEPWAGHMSGSPSEILFIFDILTFEDPLISYQIPPTCSNTPGSKIDIKSYEQLFDPLRKSSRAVKAAAASAFLVATGYHTAMECVEGTFAYLGQNIRQNLMDMGGCSNQDGAEKLDAADCFQNGASTNLMSELFDDYTNADHQFLMEI